MVRFRVGTLESLIFGFECYVIQRKRWWGWSTWGEYSSYRAVMRDARKLESRGYWVDYYI